MTVYLKKNIKLYFFFGFVLFLILFIYFFNNKFENKTVTHDPISINLLTSVHPKLPWSFKAAKTTILGKPGEVITVEYLVENLGNDETTGIATFAYFPNQFGEYVRKINCFCYDAQTLKPNQKNKFTLVLLVDPEVTKNSKTKNIKEATIQFTFFNYKDYKKNN